MWEEDNFLRIAKIASVLSVFGSDPELVAFSTFNV